MENNVEEVFKFIDQFANNLDNKERIDKKSNIFCILGVQDMEIRHSNFLAWLIDNNKKFLSLFLKTVCNLTFQESEILSNSEYDVYREYYSNDIKNLQLIDNVEYLSNNRHSIDLVIDFKQNKHLFVIENKIYSTEGDNQLAKYYYDIENNNQFTDYKKFYLYLTLNGEYPKTEEDKKHWQPLSYRTILKILQKIKPNNKNLEVEDLMIAHYIDILKNKTEMVMDRKKEYWKKYKDDANFRQVINEIIDIVPRYDERLKKLKNACSNITKYHVSIPENTISSFPQVQISELTEALTGQGLDAEFIYICLKNSIGSTSFVLEIDMNITDNSSRACYDNMGVLLKNGKKSTMLKNGYHAIYSYNFKIDETQNENYKQELICEKFIDFFNGVEPEGIIDKLLHFIKDYNFKI